MDIKKLIIEMVHCKAAKRNQIKEDMYSDLVKPFDTNPEDSSQEPEMTDPTADMPNVDEAGISLGQIEGWMWDTASTSPKVPDEQKVQDCLEIILECINNPERLEQIKQEILTGGPATDTDDPNDEGQHYSNISPEM
jgi:hypothetical protein